ncbi:putative multidrug resistance protein YpnP [Siminovitchia terrae]|uniref:MATE family efflux transporter n=1 Tax=Siminovitchia terrae TaxID=1914933 RepID=A0A429X517_SIMTE|nr:MATE family efflux transporter [Siminovitchia terrae]RST58474.1 MATE family efflux transporter [Siminovitchia terrae]GIN92256.1 putative multidrug resistance protein YpnP [Siminovitchia terrae]
MKQQDFTAGPIGKQLLSFSLPILVTNLLQTSYQFIDSLWVGNLLGANALGAVAVSSTVIFSVLSFIIGVNNATLTVLSQLKGKDDEISLRSFVNAFVVILSGMAIALGVAGVVFAKDILEFLGTPSSMIAGAVSYLQINFLGIFFLFGYNFISTVFRALGNSKTPVRFVLIAVIVNAVLDPLFIYVFEWGIEGAAYATIVAQGTAFFYGLLVSIRFKQIPFSIPKLPKREEASMILKQGIPSGLQMMVISAGLAAIMSVVTSFGPDAVAGFGAAQRLDSIIMLPAHALGTAVNSMAGQNIAVKQWERVRQITVYALLLNLAAMLLAAMIIFIFARWGIRMFISDEGAVAFGTEYVKIIAFFYPFLGLNFVWNGVVRASGAMFQVLVLNIISFWVLRYPLTFIFAQLIGEEGIGVGIAASFVISSILAFGYYRFGKWRERELFKETAQ